MNDTLDDTLDSGTLETGLRRFAPGARRPPVLDGLLGDVRYALDDFAIGRMLVAVGADGTVLTTAYAPGDGEADALLDRLARRVSPRVLRGGGRTDAVRRELTEYLNGTRRGFDLPVSTVLATGFQRSVLAGLVGVGYGSTTSYGALAAAIGRPAAARAVGTALGANPLCVLLPCHRVVAASGALTGYAGGLAAKRYLLGLEAAPDRAPDRE